MFKKFGFKSVVVAASTVAASANVFAAGEWDYTTITAGVDFSNAAVGILAVAAILAALYAGVRGAKLVLGFIRS